MGVAFFKVRVTVRAHNQNTTVSTIFYELLILFQPDLDVVHHHKPKDQGRGWIAVLKVKVAAKVKILP